MVEELMKGLEGEGWLVGVAFRVAPKVIGDNQFAAGAGNPNVKEPQPLSSQINPHLFGGFADGLVDIGCVIATDEATTTADVHGSVASAGFKVKVIEQIACGNTGMTPALEKVTQVEYIAASARGGVVEYLYGVDRWRPNGPFI